MKRAILLFAVLLTALATFSCGGNPEEKIETSLKAVQTTLPKDLGNGIIYSKAVYEKSEKTIVFGYTVDGLSDPFPEETVEAMKQAVIASLNVPAVAADPIWKMAAKAGASFRYEYALPSGASAGTFTLTPGEYQRRVQ